MKQEAEENGALITFTTLQVMCVNGHKNRPEVLGVFLRGGFFRAMETSILSPVKNASIILTAPTALVFVPRFILSSTDHCKTILICFQKQMEGENFENSEFLLLFIYFLIVVDIKMEKSKDNRFVIIVKIEKYIEYMFTILLKLPRIKKLV